MIKTTFKMFIEHWCFCLSIPLFFLILFFVCLDFRKLLETSFLHFQHRCSTGENWSLLMYACYDSAECDDMYFLKTQIRQCGNTWAARIYFTSYVFFSMFLVHFFLVSLLLLLYFVLKVLDLSHMVVNMIISLFISFYISYHSFSIF